jgi:hypothetical protein
MVLVVGYRGVNGPWFVKSRLVRVIQNAKHVALSCILKSTQRNAVSKLDRLNGRGLVLHQGRKFFEDGVVVFGGGIDDQQALEVLD